MQHSFLAHGPVLWSTMGPNNIQPCALKMSFTGREQIPAASALAPILICDRYSFTLRSWIRVGGFVVVKELGVLEMS